jgi:hypothetical protein
MIPSRFVVIQVSPSRHSKYVALRLCEICKEVPLSVNGKVDHTALPALSQVSSEWEEVTISEYLTMHKKPKKILLFVW